MNPEQPGRRGFPARVAKIQNETTVVINRGADDGVKPGTRFLIYAVGEEVLDPETGESLGRLEIVKGTGRATHVQPKLATVESDMSEPGERRVVKRNNPLFGALGMSETETIVPATDLKEFVEPETGDYAKPI